jgi:hypothetical protein
MAFDVPLFIDVSFLPGEFSAIGDYIAPFRTFNKSKPQEISKSVNTNI